MSIYIASRAKHGQKWRQLRADGYPLNASWIFESGKGETSDYADVWRRCIAEAACCDACILFAPDDDGQLQGALIEVGAALAFGRPVYFVGDVKERRYSWTAHPRVTECDDLEEALALALPHTLLAPTSGEPR